MGDGQTSEGATETPLLVAPLFTVGDDGKTSQPDADAVGERERESTEPQFLLLHNV